MLRELLYLTTKTLKLKYIFKVKESINVFRFINMNLYLIVTEKNAPENRLFTAVNK